MTYDEYVKKYKNAKAEEEKATAEEETTQGAYDRYMQKYGQSYKTEFSSNGSSMMQDFSSAYRAFTESAGSDFKTLGFTNARDMQATASKSAADLRSRASGLKAYLSANRDHMSAEDYDEAISFINRAGGAIDEAMNQYNSSLRYYSQWKTQQDYDDYVASQKDYDAKKSLDLTAAQKEIEELERKKAELERSRRQPTNTYLTGGSAQQPSHYAAGLQTVDATDKEIADLTAQISQKKQYLNQARHIQEGITLSGVAGNADFGQYSGYVSTKSDGVWDELTSQYSMGYDDLTYEYINGEENGMRQEIIRKATAFNADNNLEAMDEWQIYDHMTSDEVGIYNYYYSKEGKAAAQKYLDSIQETLNHRKAVSMYKPMEGNTALEILFGVEAGVDQFQSGIKNLLNTEDDYIAQTAYQIASGMVREDLADNGPKLPQWMGGASLGQVGYDAITTTTNMAPSMLASMAVGVINPAAGAALGTGLMGASAAGNAYQEALNMGYGKGQARVYSTLIGASEAGLQYLLGGFRKLGGKLPAKALKMLDGIDNAFLRTAGKIGGNVLSEGFEEGLQEVLTPLFKNWALQADEEINWGEVAYSGLLGALTAGVMEGPSTITGEVNTYAQGKQLKQDGFTGRLKEVGSLFAADTVAYKLAGKVNENTGAYTLGRLFNEVGATLTEQNVSDITQALVAKGMDEKTARKNAEAVAAIVDGGNLTDLQVAVIESNDVLAEAVRTTIVDPNATWFQRSNGYNEALMALAQEKTSPKAKQTQQPLSGQENATIADKVDAQHENGAEAAPAADVTSAKVKSIASISDGKVMLKLEDGSEVEAASADLDPEDGVIIETIAKIGGISANDANYILGMIKAAPGVNPQWSALGASEVYRYGFYGLSRDYITKHGVFSGSLTDAQRNAIYEAGRNARNATVQSKTQRIAENATADKNAAVAYEKTATGKVHFEGDRNALTHRQKASLTAMEKIADVLGVQIHVFESEVGKSGKRIGANGWYDPRDNSIHIDLHAGANGEGTMLFTLAHELTHHIRKWSPAKFKILSDFLMEEYGKKGVNVDGLVREQMAKAERNGRAISYDTAYEEVVADSMETMLSDGNVMKRLEKLKAKDEDLWHKIKSFIDELAEKIRSIYKGLKPDSVEGQYVADMGKAVYRLQELFAEALVDASENYQSSITPGEEGVAINQNGDPVAYSTEDGSVLLSMRTYEEDGRDAFRNYLQKCVASNKLTKTEMQEMLNGIENIYQTCKEFKDKYAPFGAWSDAAVVRDTHGRPVFSVVTPNGDYKMNLDFSLVCKKRRTLDAVFNEMSRRGIIDDFELGQKSVVKINEIIRKYGLETACALCFVDAKRFRQASMADSFTKLYNELVLSLVPEDQKGSIDHFNFSGYDTIKKVDGGIHTWDSSKLDFSHLDKVMRDYGKGTVEHKAAKYIKSHAEGRKLLLRGDFMSSQGFDAVKTQNKDILRLYNSKKGTGGPKAAFGDVQYMNEIIKKARTWTPAKAYSVGGVRIQSFSDYVPRMVFDYTQMIYDLAATKLPAHAYTKEALFVKQFGLTGVKINMSLIPAIAEDGVAPGLDANGNYVWAGESFDYETAKEIQNAEGYTENCGTICVGVSYDHTHAFNNIGTIQLNAAEHLPELIENAVLTHAEKPTHGSDYTDGVYTFFAAAKAGRIMPVKLKVKEYFYVGQNLPKNIRDYFASNPGDYASSYDAVVLEVDEIEENPSGSVRATMEDGVAPDPEEFSTIKVADLLGLVKGEYEKYLPKFSDRDSYGKRLSEDQKEFFAESRARDTFGQLHVLFHGSRNQAFTEFRTDEGVWMTTDEGYAKEYAAPWKGRGRKRTGLEAGLYSDPELRIYRVYANITNPLDLGEINEDFDRGQMDRLAKLLGVPVSRLEPLAYRNGRETITFVYQLTRKKEFIDIAKEQGYDGFYATEHDRDTFCAFNAPNQVKLTINKVPSSFYDIRYSDRDTESVSNRSLLANAFEGMAQNEIEAKKIGEYKSKIDLMDAEERKLRELNAQIKELSFAKGKRDTQKIRELRDEAIKTRNRIGIYDSQLLRLEASKPLQNVLAREKKKAYQRAEQKGKEALDTYRLKAEAKQSEILRDYREANAALRGQQSDAAIMEKEFVRIVKAYERLEAQSTTKSGKDAKTIADLRSALREESKKRNTDQKTWEAEFDRLLREYEASGRNIAKLEEKIERQRANAKAKIESREKTAMRHKIQKVVGELNQLLLNESKDRHVPDSLKKAVADALALVNMDTVDAEQRAAKYADLIAQEQAKPNPNQDKIDAYNATMENILRQGDKIGQRLKELRDAYEDISQSEDPDIANAYDPVIAGCLKELSGSIGNTSLGNMTIEQLSDVYDMYRMVLTRVRDANKSFLNAKKESISQLAGRVVGEVKRVGGEHKYRASALDPIKGFLWNNLKPVYAFEHLGSQTLTEVFNGMRAGEDTWAKDVADARAYYLDKSKKYSYNKWDFRAKYQFESDSGIPFELTLEQILSLYAYSKRDQAHEHLRLGGFVFDSNIETTKEKGGIIKYKVNTADAHQISIETLADIISTLSADQKGFVDEMQDYLSTTMGAKGNEVTMQMYGVKLFKEKHYFPLKSAKQFMFEQNEVSGEVRIKNSGFTNKTIAKANNPIILNNFMDVWSGHVNDMSMYHAFVLPLEDFNRVFNYNSPKKEGQPPVSVKGTIQNAYSPAAASYVRNLITDLNGGARTDSTTGFINKMMGMFKKGAVFASLSVVVQQPSAIARAVALVDAKYFIGPKVDHKRHKALWDEVKQYAPVAIIKEMGYFDTNMGRSTQDFITAKEYSGFTEKMKALVTDSGYRDEILSKAPALADELAWCSIWEAVKRETQAKNPGMDVKSDAFLQKAGQRFTEVITKTQVYDSVLSRSAHMRSKDTGMKMATAFMAEPTTSINMIADALLQAKRGNRRYCRAAIGAAIASNILNSILVSFVYAGRDDDEDKTYWEKYLGTLAGETLDSLNIATYIPFIKDIVSIAQGYDVERSDMAVISDLFNAWKKLDSGTLSPYRKVEAFTGSVAQIFGLPVKNIMRDVRGIYQTIESFMNGQSTTKAGIGYAVKSNIPKWMGGGEVSNQNQLYEAILSGDKTQIDRVKSRYKDEDAVSVAIRKALRENDPRVREAAQAQMNGDPSERVRIARLIIADGFTQDDVVRAINSEITALTSSKAESGEKKEKGFYSVPDFAMEIANGDEAAAYAAKTDIIRMAQKGGKTAEEAENSFNSSAKSELKDLFMAGTLSEQQAIHALPSYCGFSDEDAFVEAKYWAFMRDHPGEYVVYSWFENYYESIADSGIEVEVYMDYRNRAKGESKKAGKMSVIDSLPISDEQKDALYYAEGWAASKIDEAPWHR